MNACKQMSSKRFLIHHQTEKEKLSLPQTAQKPITNLIPGIVMDVSALFVAKTIFLFPFGGGSKTFCCSFACRRPCNGKQT
jgi:hypothetical protein